jgi:hypothetical protein
LTSRNLDGGTRKLAAGAHGRAGSVALYRGKAAAMGVIDPIKVSLFGIRLGASIDVHTRAAERRLRPHQENSPGAVSAPSTRTPGRVKARDGRLRENSPDNEGIRSQTSRRSHAQPKRPSDADQPAERFTAVTIFNLSVAGTNG